MPECTCDYATGECQAPIGCKAGAEIVLLKEAIRAFGRGDIVPITDKDAEIGRFKKTVIGKLMAQRHRLMDGMNMVERGWKTRENDAYDKAIEIVAMCDPMARAEQSLDGRPK